MRITKLLPVVFASLLLVLLPAPAQAAPLLYFLQIDGVTGSSVYKGHVGEVLCTGYDLVTDKQGVSTFSIEKLLDAATTTFVKAIEDNVGATNPNYYNTATFQGFAGTSTKSAVLKIVFTKLVVTGHESVDAGAIDAVPSEKVTFDFYQAVITYTEPSGLKSIPVTHTVTVYGTVAPPNC